MTVLRVTMLIPTDADPSTLLDLAQDAAVQLARDLDDDDMLIDEHAEEEIRGATSVQEAQSLPDEDASPERFRPQTVSIENDVALVQVAYLLACAFEGGSSYWCRIVDYREPAEPESHLPGHDRVYPHVDYPLCDGGAVICRVTSDGQSDTDYKPLTLDRDAIERGLKTMAVKSPHEWARFLDRAQDADTGDAFLQCCLLGDLVYG